jgi:hypothetical protein
MNPSVNSILSVLPPYRDKWITVTHTQDVSDIIKDICTAHRKFARYYDQFAMQFYSPSIDELCDDLYQFCKDNIEYVEENEDLQTTALPTGILTRGHGDCKHYASFIGGVLDAISRITGERIDWHYCFASYKKDQQTPYHVFVVVNGPSGPIWVDPTPGSANATPAWVINERPACIDCNTSKQSRAGVIGAIDNPASAATASTGSLPSTKSNGYSYLPDGATPANVLQAWGSAAASKQAQANAFAQAVLPVTTATQQNFNNTQLQNDLNAYMSAKSVAKPDIAYQYYMDSAANSFGISLNPADGFNANGFFLWFQLNFYTAWKQIFQATEAGESAAVSAAIAQDNVTAIKAIPALVTAIATMNPAFIAQFAATAAASGSGTSGASLVPVSQATAPAQAGLPNIPSWIWVAAAAVAFFVLVE